MTLFAGIVARKASDSILSSTRRALAGALSRFQHEDVCEISGPTFHFAKVDIGAFGSPGLSREGEDSIALLAGEPLLAQGGRSRIDDLRSIQKAVENHAMDVLRRTAGTFCAAFFDANSGELTLVADKFGVRPIYYWVGEKYVVFSTVLRVIEQLDEIPKRMDEKGVMETAAFGFPLSDRTPYLDVYAIREGQCVTIAGNKVVKTQYWYWDQLQPFCGSSSEAADIAYQEFTAAVERRLGSDKSVAAFLSGGLDSRSIVANLRQLGITVHSVNCSRPGTQDVVFGPLTATSLGCIHQQRGPQNERADDCYWKRTVMNWLKSIEHSEKGPERTRIVWSGDGGSVGLGHVYMNQQMVDLMREGRTEEASDAFLRHNRLGFLPAGALNSKSAQRLRQIPKQGMLAELNRLHCADAGRSMHLFLMINDQRRHLSNHFENIDIDRIEFQLPFFDAKFMAVILSLPIDLCLRHSFYLEWLKRFDPVVLSTPWQAYPGHLPCPLPIPPGLEYQWSEKTPPRARAERRQAVTSYLKARLACRQFPRETLNGTSLAIATLLTYTGMQNYAYVLHFASLVLRYSGGLSATRT